MNIRMSRMRDDKGCEREGRGRGEARRRGEVRRVHANKGWKGGKVEAERRKGENSRILIIKQRSGTSDKK